ncbi:3-hydroxybenzoate 6-hydroxylase 1 [Podospora aff. communis PSN243]|uniref:3-hydroxybenzoate 6-hydroxylase 1 n=1 Tax=Podospora aff. communis PSN243 TaxID=3040156 RepID=A0AAV9GV65_9PEZI|nr:3-hydroxybenzoate 6-hydroxylase 1 [Podospora aff. communis PSN243]
MNGNTSHRYVKHTSPEPNRTAPLKIVIVGAGIGGLASAIGFRRNGHQVHIYEQSRFANEAGAAVHLAPNANGILRRWGILAEEIGGNLMDRLIERMSDGQLRQDIDLTIPNKRWQHPWHLVHRVNLHDRLKQLATSEVGVGAPVKLHTASKVVAVDSEKGSFTLKDGSTGTADLIVGADGIYSMTRKYIQDAQLFSSGKAAFRFLIPRHEIEVDPATAPLVERKNALSLWFGHDRRVVMYPCNGNELLNIVCIHPESESQATQSDEWNKQASIEQVLKVYKNFDPALKALMSKVDSTKVQVWQLLDMEKLPTWVSGKLVLLGDSAHPFTPHQGQGAAQAIEDAAVLTSILPPGTVSCEIPERLGIYEEIRYERAHVIQEYSRLAGKDWVNDKSAVDMMKYTNYNLGYDAIDHARTVFQRHLWSKSHPWPNLPSPFGPFSCPSHSQSPEYRLSPFNGKPPSSCPHLITTATVKIKTSATFLESLFPTASLKFSSPGTVTTASFVAKHISYKDGTETAHLGLYIPNIQTTDADGPHKSGTYLPLLLTSAADDHPPNHGPRVRCDVAVVSSSSEGTCRVVASSGGVSFVEITLSDLVERMLSPEEQVAKPEMDDSHLVYLSRNIASSSNEGLGSENGEGSPEQWDCGTQRGDSCNLNHTAGGRRRSMAASPQDGKGVELKMHARSWDELPGLHHVAAVLAEVPVLKILEGTVEVLESERR